MRFILGFLIAIALAGCCKVHCDGTELNISFEKFKATETDTIIFFSYVPGNGQIQLVDSFRLLSNIPPADTSKSSVSHSISSKYDWRIILPSLNKQYVFDNFDLGSDKCKCGGNQYKFISSFMVNGVRKEGLFIRLD